MRCSGRLAKRYRTVVAALLFGAGAAAQAAIGDFNGDGIGDVAIGVPNEDVLVNGTNHSAAGIVVVLYGSANGVATTAAGIPASQLLHQNVGTLADNVEANDRFGAATAAGDFNADGFADLAIVARGDNAVQVLFGSASGLRTDTSQLFLATQIDDLNGQTWRPCGSEASSSCSMVSGDFDGNGTADIAIEGHETDPTELVVSKVAVLYGTAANGTGFTDIELFRFTNNQRFLPDAELGGVSVSLATGDVDNNGADDLAIGLPFANLQGSNGLPLIDAGRVNVLLGASVGGLGTNGFRTLLQSTGSTDASEIGNRYGSAVALGDFDNDGRDDLAVGVPFDDRGNVADEGSVRVYRSAETFHSLLTQNQLALPRDGSDRFGAALTTGDFDGDGHDDLAIGVPGDFIHQFSGDNAGSAIVIHGGITGLAATNGPGFLHIAQDNSAGTSEANDRFGSRLEAGNVGRSTHADLIAGVPGEDLFFGKAPANTQCNFLSCLGVSGNVVDAGVVNIVYGSASSLGETGAQSLSQSSSNVPDIAESNDAFGG